MFLKSYRPVTVQSKALLRIRNDNSNCYKVVDLFNHMDIYMSTYYVLNVWTRANGHYNWIYLSIQT